MTISLITQRSVDSISIVMTLIQFMTAKPNGVLARKTIIEIINKR